MKIKICKGKACSGKFSSYIEDRLKGDIEFFNIDGVEISSSPCMGCCKKGPNIKINGEIIEKCSPIIASKIMNKKLKNK